MKLPGAPWRVEKSTGYIDIVDVNDTVIASYDLEDFSPEEIKKIDLVTRAIASLPGLFELLGEIAVADEKNDSEAAGSAVDALMAIYRVAKAVQEQMG